MLSSLWSSGLALGLDAGTFDSGKTCLTAESRLFVLDGSCGRKLVCRLGCVIAVTCGGLELGSLEIGSTWFR